MKTNNVKKIIFKSNCKNVVIGSSVFDSNWLCVFYFIFFAVKVMRTNTNEEKCKEQHSSVTRGVSCTHPGRYSFAKRACVGEPSEPDLQIPSDHTHESFSSSFPSVGSQRVYFDEPILLKKGDILGVSVIKGRIAATVNDENPDCVLSVDSTLCSNQGIEARARFMVLGSSKVMVKALTPPDVTEDITVEWHFENDLGTAQVEGTLEYLQPVENIEITGEDTRKYRHKLIYENFYRLKCGNNI